MSPPPSSSPAPAATAGPSTPSRKSSGDEKPEVPWAFIDCPTDTLVVLISHMLNLLIQHNDQVILTPDALTRFHSRAAPGISVIEYLRRIVKYTNMEKIPLLSLLAYIDITCQHLPTFTLSSLTVHRFLIAGVCAGSKAQCDVFCTNGHYAKVGGIKVQELNSLERELLRVTQWALCCNADLLQRYYTSLIKSHGGYTQAAAPSTTPFRTFPRSSSKPRKSSASASPAPMRAASTPRTDPIEEDPADTGAYVSTPAPVEEVEVEAERADEEMTGETAESGAREDEMVVGDADGVEPPDAGGSTTGEGGGGGDGMDVDPDPPDQTAAGSSSNPQFSPHSDGSSSIPSSNASPRSSRSRRSRMTSLQHKAAREGVPASPRIERLTASGRTTPVVTAQNGAGDPGPSSNPYEKAIGEDEEMLVAPPPPSVPPPSSSAISSTAHPPNPTTTRAAAPTPQGTQAQAHVQHHHHLHAPNTKAIKNFVGGIFHRKTPEPHDAHPPSRQGSGSGSASAAAPARPTSRGATSTDSMAREPVLQYTNLHNGLEETVPPRPTHPEGEGEPWQPSSLIPASSRPTSTTTTSTSSAGAADSVTSPRRTARIPGSPRVGPGTSMASPRLAAAAKPDAAVPVTPKVRSRDERSVDALRSAPPPLGAAMGVGAVGGEEGKRRAV